jgi:hypothetical protein
VGLDKMARHWSVSACRLNLLVGGTFNRDPVPRVFPIVGPALQLKLMTALELQAARGMSVADDIFSKVAKD